MPDGSPPLGPRGARIVLVARTELELTAQVRRLRDAGGEAIGVVRTRTPDTRIMILRRLSSGVRGTTRDQSGGDVPQEGKLSSMPVA
jgi:hypothetical protein